MDTYEIQEPETNAEEIQEHYTDKEVFTQIWFSPRKIFRFIDRTGYDKYFYVLMFGAGIDRGFTRASLRNMGDTFSIEAILAICILAGGLLGWISYYFFAYLIKLTGSLFGGTAETHSIFRIMGYACIPVVCSMIFLIPQIALYGNVIYRSDFNIENVSGSHAIILIVSMILEFLVGVWTIPFIVIGVSEIQQFSIWKSLASIFLPLIVLVFIIVIVVLN